MPTLIYFCAREPPLRIEQEVEDIAGLFRTTPDKPVPLTAEDGGVVFANWQNVAYLEAEPKPEV